MKKTLFITAMLMAFCLLIFQACKKDRTTVFVNNKGNNNGNPVTNYPVNTLATWSKKAPQKQSFTINAASGQWITGAKGSMFYFPANSLLDASNNPVTGSVDIELKEYMNKADMLFSGITVTSGNQLLESGGMFYLMARKNGQELHLKNNVGFTMIIPQSNQGEDPMNIWEGNPNQRDSLNKIDWVKKDSVPIKPVQDSAQQQKKKYFQQFNYFKFGYCNIDREAFKFKNLIKKFRIKMPDGCNDTNSTALLLFKTYNCCAWCHWLTIEDRMATYYQLPLGEVAKVLIYKKTGPGDDDLEYAVKEFTFTDETEVEFTSMTKCTNLELENLIKAL